MFKDIFSDNLNRLVYMTPPKSPERARASAGRAKEKAGESAIAKGINAVEKAFSRAPETKEQKQANKWMENIFRASGSRTRYEKMKPSDAARLTTRVGTEIQKYMRGKKEAVIPAANGNTLLIKKVSGGIVAVAFEAQANERAPRPAEHIVIGRVGNHSRVAANIVSEYYGSALHAQQEKIAKIVQPRIGRNKPYRSTSDLSRLTRPSA